MKKLLLLTVCAIVGLTAMAKGENDTIVTFSINPMMHCINCENKVKSNLRFEKGIKEIKAEAPDSVVTITFDKRKTNVDNIAKGFAKIGYTATPAESTPCNKKKSCDSKQGCCATKKEGCNKK